MTCANRLLASLRSSSFIARVADVPIVDAYRLWFYQTNDGHDLHAHLANGINHPDRQFHSMLASEMANMLLSSVMPPA
jgi:hypothetical protein